MEAATEELLAAFIFAVMIGLPFLVAAWSRDR